MKDLFEIPEVLLAIFRKFDKIAVAPLKLEQFSFIDGLILVAPPRVKLLSFIDGLIRVAPLTSWSSIAQYIRISII